MQFQYVKEISSTHDFMVEQLPSLAQDEMRVIQAEHQSEGHGRRHRVWRSEPGEQVLLSLGYQPVGLRIDQAFSLNMMMSSAAVEVLKNLGIHAMVKWPNDVIVDHRKIAGILIHNVFGGHDVRGTVISLGMNILGHPPLDGRIATSAQFWVDVPLDVKAIGRSVVMQFIKLDQQRRREGIGPIYERWRGQLYGLGQEHTFISSQPLPIRAELLDVTPEGQLILQHKGQAVSYEIDEMKLVLQG